MDNPSSFKRGRRPNNEIALMKKAHLKDLMKERRFIAAAEIAHAMVAGGIDLDADWIAKQAVKIADALLDELS